MKTKITTIGDRYQLTLVGFHRNYSDLGRLYHPTESSKSRLGRTLVKGITEGTIVALQNMENPNVYKYIIG